MLAPQELTDVFRSACQGIVGGYGYQNRSSVAQVAFCGHSHRGVSNAVGQFCQRVSGTGSDDQRVQKLFRANGFYLGDGIQRIFLADLRCLSDVTLGGAETRIGHIGSRGEDRRLIMFFCQCFHNGKDICVCTKRTAHGKTDVHKAYSFPCRRRMTVLAMRLPEVSGAYFPGRPRALTTLFPAIPG